MGIRGKKVNWILDMDLKGFFDNIDQEHLMEMVERRIADPRILRLIRKWLNAGVIEHGTAQPTAAHLGKAGKTIRSMATRSPFCS